MTTKKHRHEKKPADRAEGLDQENADVVNSGEGLDDEPIAETIETIFEDPDRTDESFRQLDNHRSIPAALPFLFAAIQGQVIDTAGNQWAYAILQFSLFLPSGEKPIDLTTGLVIPNPAPIICDATGNFSANLQLTAFIVPVSLWQLTIFPFNNKVAGQTLDPFEVTGATNLSASIAANLNPHVDNPLILPMSNSGTNGQSTSNGSIYFDAAANLVMIRNPATQAYEPIPLPADVNIPGLLQAGNIETTANNYAGLDTPAQGCLIGWNTSGSHGETDFINSTAGAGGQFRWYSEAPGTSVDDTTTPSMELDPSGILHVAGSGQFGQGITTNGIPAGQVANELTMGTNANGAFFDMYGSSPTGYGLFAFRVSTGDGSAFVQTLFLNQTGATIEGNLTATGSKNFKIPHPTKPGHSLVHSCIEGPENAVFYRGEGETTNGGAEISLPDYFEALTLPTHRTVQLTLLVDDADPIFGGAIAAGRVTGGKFKVYSTDPTAKFYWEVKAIRRDLDRLIVEPAMTQQRSV
jgi:hypothetical protein